VQVAALEEEPAAGAKHVAQADASQRESNVVQQVGVSKMSFAAIMLKNAACRMLSVALALVSTLPFHDRNIC
jgi:hypothetical protein